MKQYRVISISEHGDYSEHECIECKRHFVTINDELGYEYCPRCGIKFDGCFTKRNPRWDTRRWVDWRNPGYEVSSGKPLSSDRPRLVIQLGSWQGRVTLANDSFAVLVNPLAPQRLVWSLYQHQEVGLGVSHRMMSHYRRCTTPIKRLVLVHKTDVRIICQEGC